MQGYTLAGKYKSGCLHNTTTEEEETLWHMFDDEFWPSYWTRRDLKLYILICIYNCIYMGFFDIKSDQYVSSIVIYNAMLCKGIAAKT